MIGQEYLAIPYSSDDESEMDYRAEVSDFIFSVLSKEGRTIYAPISSCHHIAKTYGLPRDFKFWKSMCEVFVSNSVKVIVVMLPGWKESVGVMAEIELAETLGIEIEYLDPADYLDMFPGLEAKYGSQSNS
jgi:hypothetical protein